MVVTNDHELPTYEELTVEEVPISSPGLRAAAHHIGNFFITIETILNMSTILLLGVDNCILCVHCI